MSNNYYFAIKTILTNPIVGATVAEIGETGIANPTATVAKLRARGHEIFSVPVYGTRKVRYVMPFGARSQSQKMTKVARKEALRSVGLPVKFA